MSALTRLSQREAALLAAAADAFFPPEGPIPISGCDAGIVSYFERYVGRSGAEQAFLMRLLFVFMELSPLAFGRVRRRFSQLSHSERIEHLHQAFVSRIYFRRVSFISLRALMTMAYLSNDDVARHLRMRHDPDPFRTGRVCQAEVA